MKKHFKLDITNKQYRSVLLLSYSTIAIIAIAIVLTGLFPGSMSIPKGLYIISL